MTAARMIADERPKPWPGDPVPPDQGSPVEFDELKGGGHMFGGGNG